MHAFSLSMSEEVAEDQINVKVVISVLMCRYDMTYLPVPWCLSCVCLLQSGHFSEDMIPTVGFNMRKVTKGNVTIKVWQ